MEIDEKQGWMPRFLVVASVTAASLVWLVPVLMLPFVNVLPYLHTMPNSQRLGLSAVFYLLVCVVARGGVTRKQWAAVRSRTFRTWKDTLGFGIGLLMATYAAAALSGNTLGLLVRLVPGQEVTREFSVVKAKSSGSNFKATELELSLPSDPQFYEIVLSKRIFGELPKIRPGDVVRFEAVENIFGTYVLRVSIKG